MLTLNFQIIKSVNFKQMSLVFILFAFLYLIQVSPQNQNLYPTCALIDVVSNKCLKCISDSYQLSQDQCISISGSTQPNLISTSNSQNSISTSIFYAQPVQNQNDQSSSQNQVSTQRIQTTQVLNSSNFQSSNIANILSLFASYSSGSQNTQPSVQAASQNNYFLPFVPQQAQQASYPNQFAQISGNSTPAGTYSDNNCKTVNQGKTGCVQCYSFFYFNQTTQNCQSVNPLCQIWTDRNECTSCYVGYSLSKGNCVPNASYQANNQPRDDNCKLWLNGICQQCYLGYYYNSLQQLCKVMNPICLTCNNQGACTSCYSGYTLDPTLTVCITNSSNSSQSSPNVQATSTNASSNILNQGNNNLLISQIFGNSNSLSQNNCINIGDYLFCQYGGFILQFSAQGNQMQLINSVPVNGQSSGPVVAPSSSTSSIPFSTSASSSTTSGSSSSGSPTCYFRQVNINGNCINVSDYCKQWDSSANCTSCYQGYSNFSGVCKRTE